MSYNLLKGKRGVIFGALNDKSIAWKVAEKAVEEGAIITLSNTPVAVRMGEVSQLGEKLNAEVLLQSTEAFWLSATSLLSVQCSDTTIWLMPRLFLSL